MCEKPDRRAFLGGGLMAAAALFTAGPSVLLAAGPSHAGQEHGGTPQKDAISADRALELLREGNARFAANKPDRPNQTDQRRIFVATKGQNPFAAILTCSDSRVPPELVFDRGLGDLFTVRVAGNVAGVSERGSLEYGVEHLKIPLVVVLGHSGCGAVKAVVDHEHVEGDLATLAKMIVPAFEKAKKDNPGVEDTKLLDGAIKNNVWQSVEDIFKASQAIKTAAKDGHVKVVGAVLQILSGQVTWMGEHPEQRRLLG